MEDIKAIERDIQDLEAMAISEMVDIRGIESQLIKRELETNGEDEYFEWRASALLAITAKRKNYAAITYQATHWKRALKNLRKKKKALTTEREKEKLRLKAEGQNLHLKNLEIAKIKNENKIKMRNEALNKDLLVFKEFKKAVKELLGEDEYIKLITAASEAVNNE